MVDGETEGSDAPPERNAREPADPPQMICGGFSRPPADVCEIGGEDARRLSAERYPISPPDPEGSPRRPSALSVVVWLAQATRCAARGDPLDPSLSRVPYRAVTH
jgi:hypothetical protein